MEGAVFSATGVSGRVQSSQSGVSHAGRFCLLGVSGWLCILSPGFEVRSVFLASGVEGRLCFLSQWWRRQDYFLSTNGGSGWALSSQSMTSQFGFGLLSQSCMSQTLSSYPMMNSYDLYSQPLVSMVGLCLLSKWCLRLSSVFLDSDVTGRALSSQPIVLQVGFCSLRHLSIRNVLSSQPMVFSSRARLLSQWYFRQVSSNGIQCRQGFAFLADVSSQALSSQPIVQQVEQCLLSQLCLRKGPVFSASGDPGRKGLVLSANSVSGCALHILLYISVSRRGLHTDLKGLSGEI